MSENSWVLRGVDPDTRQLAVEEAERRGVSLADYLTEALLHGGGNAEDVSEAEFDVEAHPAEADESFFPPLPEPNFAVRHRIEALERRLGLSVGGLDSAVHALDSSVYGLAARVDETEALATDTAHSLNTGLQDLSGSLAALRKRLADAEDAAEALSENNDAAHDAIIERCAGLDQRLAGVERAARGAQDGVDALTEAHEALKHAVADDFSELARESAARLSAGLSELTAAADAAAEQADAAAAHLFRQLAELRESIEQRMEQSASETRGRMHAAFADAADRLAALAERVVDNERYSARTADQLRVQIANVEDGAQTALEEAAEALRQNDAALAAEVRGNAEDHRAALHATTSALSGELAELRDRHEGGMARLKLVDAAVSNTINDVALLRAAVEDRIEAAAGDARTVLAQVQGDWEARFEALTARTAAGERDAAQTHQALRHDIDRVETCTFAALEKLAQDVAGLDAAVAAKLARAAKNTETAIGDMRDQQVGALARLKLIDRAIGGEDMIAAAEAGAPPLAARLARLEEAVSQTGTDPALSLLQNQVMGLAAQLEGETDRASAQSEERLHNIELALADMRLERLSAPAETAATDHDAGAAMQALEQRMAGLEQRQAEAFESLRADIAHFVSANERRLAALETGGAQPQGDLAAEFEELRRRIEERVLGVELRSVRTMEQVCDTVALIEQRFLSNEPDEAEAKSA